MPTTIEGTPFSTSRASLTKRPTLLVPNSAT